MLPVAPPAFGKMRLAIGRENHSEFTTGARFEDQPLVPKPSLGWCCLPK